MEGEKLNLLKQSFVSMLEYLTPKDRLSIVVFDSTARRITPLLTMTEKNKAFSINELNKVHASGGTDIADGMNHALEILKQRREVNNVSSILLLSDGLDSGAEAKTQYLVNSFSNSIKNTYSINTFGYGSDHDPKLMSNIAELRDGRYYFIDKLDKVDECFVDCLGALLSVVVENVSIRIKPASENVAIKRIFGIEGFWKAENDGSYSALVLQLISGKTIDYVAEIELSNLDKVTVGSDNQFLVAMAEIECFTLKEQGSNKIIKKCEAFVNLDDDLLSLVTPKENEYVMKNYYRVKSAETIEQARKLSEKSQNKKAEELLIELKELIQNSSVKKMMILL